MAEIALIVEPNFSSIHVGVRRVIQHHWLDLTQKGHNVSLITYSNSNFYGATPLGELFQVSKQTRNPTSFPFADWSAIKGLFPEIPSGTSSTHREDQIKKWNFDRKINLREYERTILTNPWMVSHDGFPRNVEYSDGLIHDTVPIQLARSELFFNQFVPVYAFAREHSIGFDFMVKNVGTITANSAATRKDFLKEYPTLEPSRVKVAIPFTPLPPQNPGDERPQGKTISILNSLDPRKNFGTIKESLLSHPKISEFSIQVIGAARMHDQVTHDFLVTLASKCESLSWYKQPSDFQLSKLLSLSDLLFFPSFYEGLGLPVLEAQGQGIPALTSDTPALAEINQNPHLIKNSSDTKGMITAIDLALEKDSKILYGESLVQKQNRFLSGRTSLVSSIS